jgi:mRNA-degrading endonuclease toxin of MazEF toxin-antitoxin module
MMSEPIKTYKTYEIVVVPFPFTDQKKSKNRPALILSSELFNAKNGKSIMAMITSNTGKELWPNDVAIKDLKTTGLLEPSLIRFKIFTIDHVLIKARIGFLHDKDKKVVQVTLKEILNV